MNYPKFFVIEPGIVDIIDVSYFFGYISRMVLPWNHLLRVQFNFLVDIQVWNYRIGEFLFFMI